MHSFVLAEETINKLSYLNSLNLKLKLAINYNNISLVYQKLGDLREALKFSELSLFLMEFCFDKNDVNMLKNYNNLSSIYLDLGKFAKALEFSTKALNIKEKILDKNHSQLTTSYNRVSLIYQKLINFEKALEFANKSLNINNKISNNHFNIALNYNDISSIYLNLGNFEKALKFSKKALSVLIKNNHPYSVIIYLNISIIYHDLGKLNKALQFANRPLKSSKQILNKNNVFFAANYFTISAIYQKLKKPKTALEFANKSLEIYKKFFNKHNSIANLYLHISWIYKDLGDFKNALKFAKKALSIIQNIYPVNHLLLAGKYHNIGGMYYILKKLPEASKFIEKALAIREKVLDKNHPKLTTSYIYASWIFRDLKDYNNSYRYIQKALNGIINYRNIVFSLSDYNQKYKYLENNKYFFNTFLSVSLICSQKSKIKNTKQKLNQEILASWLKYKGEITNTQNLLLKLKNQTKNEALKVKIANLFNLNTEYANLLLKTLKERQNPLKYIKLLKAKLAKKELLEEELSKKLYAFKNQRELQSIDTKKLSKLLGDDELYIDFAKGGKEYYIFTLNSKNEATFDLIKDFREEKVYEFIKNRDKKYNELSKKLYTIFFKDKIKNYKKLIISQDGILHKLPFEALINPKTKKYLIEEKEIVYIPSGKEFLRLKNREKIFHKNDGNIVIFSNPNFKMDLAEIKKDGRGVEEINSMKKFFRKEFTYLNGTKIEAQHIKNIFPNTTVNFSQNSAIEQNLFAIKSPKILHLATHGFFIDDANYTNSNLKSGIALSGYNRSVFESNSTEGIVTSSDLLKLDLRGTELVVFSACDSGLGDIKRAEGVEGLNKAVIQAGANRVLMTLWKIDDKKSAEFMKYFYTFLKEGQGYSQALRSTKIKMIKEKFSPHFWAGFILNGVD